MPTITVLIQMYHASNLSMSLFNQALPKTMFYRLRFFQLASAAGMVTGLSTLGVSVALGLVLEFSGNKYQLTFLASGMFAAVAVLLNFFSIQRVNPESRSLHLGCHASVTV